MDCYYLKQRNTMRYFFLSLPIGALVHFIINKRFPVGSNLLKLAFVFLVTIASLSVLRILGFWQWNRIGRDASRALLILYFPNLNNSSPFPRPTRCQAGGPSLTIKGRGISSLFSSLDSNGETSPLQGEVETNSPDEVE